MRRDISRAVMRGVLLLASSSISTCAWAQASQNSSPRAYFDNNGVEVFSGTYDLSVAVASIGGTQRFTWQQGRNDVSRTRFFRRTVSGQTEYVVAIGDAEMVFLKSGSAFVSKVVDGSKLEGSGAYLSAPAYRFTWPSGDVLTFTRMSMMGMNGARLVEDESTAYLPTSVKYANGSFATYVYEKMTMDDGSGLPPQTYVRLGSIKMSSGYVLRILYALITRQAPMH